MSVPEPFIIQTVGPKGIGTIRSIAHSTWPVAYARILSPEQLAYMLERMYSETALQQQMEHGHVFFILEQGGSPIGFASFEHAAAPNNGARLHKLYVLPIAQGRGAGNFLLEAVHSAVKENGGKTVDLNVNRSNPAIGFYERCGYAVLREEVLDIGHGFVMDDFVMRKTLTSS